MLRYLLLSLALLVHTTAAASLRAAGAGANVHRRLDDEDDENETIPFFTAVNLNLNNAAFTALSTVMITAFAVAAVLTSQFLRGH